jgi:hypothetical protein
MTHFRCRFLDSTEQVVSEQDLVVESAADALRLAQAFAQRGHNTAFELWQGKRRLYRESRAAND